MTIASLARLMATLSTPAIRLRLISESAAQTPQTILRIRPLPLGWRAKARPAASKAAGSGGKHRQRGGQRNTVEPCRAGYLRRRKQPGAKNLGTAAGAGERRFPGWRRSGR